MIKIKFDIGNNEIINCYAKIIKTENNIYKIVLKNGSFDNYCKFNKEKRKFYGYN